MDLETARTLQPGDRLRCVIGNDLLNEGQIYTFRRCEMPPSNPSNRIVLDGPYAGEPFKGWAASRFELHSRATPVDPISPPHYARYAIQPATFIAANKLPFDVGNVIKYVMRYDAKNGREDLMKAERYLEMLIGRLDREARVAAGELLCDVWKEAL
jgi:hypothetical protein